MFRETTTCSPTSSYDGKFSVSRKAATKKLSMRTSTPKLAQIFLTEFSTFVRSNFVHSTYICRRHWFPTLLRISVGCLWICHPRWKFPVGFLLGAAGLYWFMMEPASNLLVFCWLADGSSKVLTDFLLAPAGCLLACRWFQQGAYWFSAGLDRLRAGLLLVPAECLLVFCTGSSRILVLSWDAASNLLVFSRLELVPTMLSVVLFGPELTSPSIHSWS